MSRTPRRLAAAEMPVLARREYREFGQLLHRLDAEQWTLPTDCSAWDVRQLVAHVLGATEANARPTEMLRQLRRGRRGTRFDVDAVSAVQVADRERLAPRELCARFEGAADQAVRWRIRWLRAAGWMPLPVGSPLFETWRLGYLVGTVYTRDVWMHRVDLARASGLEMRMTAEHDGRIVEDVVADWAGRHGRAYALRLSGPAGGSFGSGDGAAETSLDAVQFCRTLSGRGTGRALLATTVPF